MVVIDPSLPWLMALSIGMTSAPRTSPTRTRSGVIRSAHRTSSARVISPSPSVLGSLLCIATTSGWASGVPVQAQLERVLDGDQPLVFGDGAGQRPQHRRLADRGAAGDQQVLAGLDQRREERGEGLVDGAVADQLAQPGPFQAVAADRDARPSGDRLDREQPPAAGQRHRHARGGAVEAALLDPAPGGDRADQVGQLLVAGRDRRNLGAVAAGVLDEHLVAPVGVDRLDVGVVQVGLEAAQAPQVGVDAVRDLLLGRLVQRSPPAVEGGRGLLLHGLADQRAAQPGAGCGGHGAVPAGLLRHPVRDQAAQPLHQLVVRFAARPHGPAVNLGHRRPPPSGQGPAARPEGLARRAGVPGRSPAPWRQRRPRAAAAAAAPARGRRRGGQLLHRPRVGRQRSLHGDAEDAGDLLSRVGRLGRRPAVTGRQDDDEPQPRLLQSADPRLQVRQLADPRAGPPAP